MARKASTLVKGCVSFPHWLARVKVVQAVAALLMNHIIPATVIVAVPVAVPPLELVTVYVNVSFPMNPDGGSYVKLPSAEITTLLQPAQLALENVPAVIAGAVFVAGSISFDRRS